MLCKKCRKNMKLVSTWIEGNKGLSEYKCDCGHVQIVENMKIEKKETKIMIRQVPEWAQVHLTRLLQILKQKLPNNYKDGKYTIELIIWTDNSFQINIKSTDVADELIQHTFTWNSDIGYTDSKCIEGKRLIE